MGITPGSTEKAKDGTVWFHHKVGDFSAHETPQTTFNGSGGQTEFPTRKITSRLQSFLCLLDISMLLTIRDCTVQEGRRTNPSWQMSVFELMAFLAILFRRAAKGYIGAMRLMWANRFGNPDIKAIMPRNRFLEIKRYLCFGNKDTRKERIQTTNLQQFQTSGNGLFRIVCCPTVQGNMLLWMCSYFLQRFVVPLCSTLHQSLTSLESSFGLQQIWTQNTCVMPSLTREEIPLIRQERGCQRMLF